MIKLALTKGRIEKETCKLLEKAGFDIESIRNKDRELVIRTKDELEVIFVKSNDVITFVEKGIVDIGVVGKDTLDESKNSEYNELLDLEIGKCIFAVAAYPEYESKIVNRRKVIATKYPNIARKYFNSKGEDVEIIKMEGSVELGPIVGLSDVIVDIVETGNTLRANGLEVMEEISSISTRLITNRVRLKYKSDEIYNIVDKLINVIEEGKNGK